MLRTEQASERRRREIADLLVLPRPAKSLQNDVGFSGKLEPTAPKKKKIVASVSQREQLSSRPELFLPKPKGTEPFICPEHQIVKWERVKVSKNCTLAREMEIRAMERKGWTPP